ncbi:MAG: hypothetical protein AAB556_01730 [Patescibacteria group bacterium]
MPAEREWIIQEGKLCGCLPTNLLQSDIVRVALYGDNVEPEFYFLQCCHRVDFITFKKFSGGTITPRFENVAYAERVAKVGTIQHEIMVDLILKNENLNKALDIITKLMEKAKKDPGYLKNQLEI